MDGKKLAKSKASFVDFRWVVVGVEEVSQIESRFWGLLCLVEVGSVASGSDSRVVPGWGKKTYETIGPVVAVIEDSGLVSGGGRQRRFMAAGLMARKSAGPTPLRHQPLGNRWLRIVCLAALRPVGVV